MFNINITDTAANRIAEILSEETTPSMLRIFVQGGGCSGFSYAFDVATKVEEDDFKIDKNGITVLIDAMSYPYLEGATVDYVENIMGSTFNIENPNAKSTCGCGSSFSV